LRALRFGATLSLSTPGQPMNMLIHRALTIAAAALLATALNTAGAADAGPTATPT